ncbi:hypothetical protein VTJ04DRAFT_9741 [Mycothermus thermophilus]
MLGKKPIRVSADCGAEPIVLAA